VAGLAVSTLTEDTIHDGGAVLDDWAQLLAINGLCDSRPTGVPDQAGDLAATESATALNQAAEDVAWLLLLAAGFRFSRSEPRTALPLYERSLAIYREQLGDDHPDTLTAACSLAQCFSVLGEFEKACELDRDTLRRRRAVLGPEHPRTLQSERLVAIDLRGLGDDGQAREIDERLFAHYRRVHGMDFMATLLAAGDLGLDLRILGEAEKRTRFIKT
jgi:Tetratricopeptide repeat